MPPIPLKLTIPTTRNLHNPPPARANTRDSETTEFEEDGGQSTIVSPNGGLVWRPPSSAVAPATATATTAPYYVADRNGNWVLADSARGNTLAAEMQTPISPPEIRSAQQMPIVAVRTGGSGSGSGDKGPDPRVGGPGKQQQQQHASLVPPADSMRSQASSIYSQQSSTQPQSRPLFPRPFPSIQQQQQPPQQQPPQQQQQIQPPPKRHSLIRVVSSSSSGGETTPIETSSGSDPSPPEAPGALSPVMESPSREGRSVPAPAIVPARNNRRTQYLAPPPARGTTYFAPGQPQQQHNPANTAQRPGQQEQGAASSDLPTKSRRFVQDPSQERTGSPTLRMVEPSPEPETTASTAAAAAAAAVDRNGPPREAINDARQNLPSVRARNSLVRPPSNSYGREARQQQQQTYQTSSRMSNGPQSFDQPYPYPLIHPSPFGPYPQYQRQHQQQRPAETSRPSPAQGQPHHPSAAAYSQHPQQQYKQQRQPRQQQQPYPLNSHARNPYQAHPQQPPYPQPQTQLPQPPAPIRDLQSPASVNSAASSAASSLMARRLGAERAAQMNLPTNEEQRTGKWRREGGQLPEPAAHHPGGGHSHHSHHGSGSGSGSVSGSGSGSGSAPGWGVPRMTPTRKGDELFLNVHV